MTGPVSGLTILPQGTNQDFRAALPLVEERFGESCVERIGTPTSSWMLGSLVALEALHHAVGSDDQLRARQREYRRVHLDRFGSGLIERAGLIEWSRAGLIEAAEARQHTLHLL